MSAFKKTLTASALALAIALPGTVSAHAGLVGFEDTPYTMEHYEHIAIARVEGITNGYPDGTFRPYENISREAVAAFLYRFLKHEPYTGNTNCFVDVNPYTTGFSTEICWLKSTGITKGWDDGTFRPRDKISREAFVAFLGRVVEDTNIASGGAMDKSLVLRFRDVEAKNMFAPQIAWAAHYKITQGWDDGTFRPHAPIQRVAVITMLDRIREMPEGENYRNVFNSSTAEQADTLAPLDDPAETTMDQKAQTKNTVEPSVTDKGNAETATDNAANADPEFMADTKDALAEAKAALEQAKKELDMAGKTIDEAKATPPVALELLKKYQKAFKEIQKKAETTQK